MLRAHSWEIRKLINKRVIVNIWIKIHLCLYKCSPAHTYIRSYTTKEIAVHRAKQCVCVSYNSKSNKCFTSSTYEENLRFCETDKPFSFFVATFSFCILLFLPSFHLYWFRSYLRLSTIHWAAMVKKSNKTAIKTTKLNKNDERTEKRATYTNTFLPFSDRMK